MAFTLGLAGRTYWNNLVADGGTGTPTSPDWTELGNQQDVTLSMNASESDVTVRGGGGWALYAAALLDAEMSWGMVYDPTETGFAKIKDTFFAKTEIHLYFADGDITVTGSYEGLESWCVIRDMGRNEELAEAMKSDVVARPTYFVDQGAIVPPVWRQTVTP